MGSFIPYYSTTDMTKYADDVVSVAPVKELSDVEAIIRNEMACVDQHGALPRPPDGSTQTIRPTFRMPTAIHVM